MFFRFKLKLSSIHFYLTLYSLAKIFFGTLKPIAVPGPELPNRIIGCAPKRNVLLTFKKYGFSSTDAAPHLFDDPHVRLQSSRWILASPCDTALGRHGGMEWPEHDILVLESF
jgi:hypothetical protein